MKVKLKGYTNEFRLDKTRSDFDDDKPAVIDHAKQTSWTYQQLNARADNMAHYLTSQGVKKAMLSVFLRQMILQY